MTASAVSHQIKNLEKELGFSLFDRQGRSLSLSGSGATLFDEVEPLIDQLDAVTRKHKLRILREELKVSVQPFFASELFIPKLSEFTEQHPEIDLLVDTSDESSERLPSDADISIRLFRHTPDRDADLLFPLRLVPAGSPKFSSRLIVKDRRIVSDFPLVVHNTTPTAWIEWTRKHDIELPAGSQTIRLDSMIAVARAAERSMGAALIPVPLSNSWFETGALVPLFAKALIVEGGYYLVSNRKRQRDGTVRILREWILSTFAESTHKTAA